MNSEREFKTKLTALFEFYPDAVYLQTLDGKIIDCNTAASDMTGYSRKELLKLEAKDLFQDDMFTSIPFILEEESSESGFAVNGLCRKKNGDSCPVTIDMRLFRADDKHYVFAFVRDITEKKKAEEEMEKLEHQLKQAQKMGLIGQLAGGITHYYNNIFTGILGALSIAQRDASREILPLLRRAEKAANLASGFTRRLLAFSRESEIMAEPTDVGALIENVADFARVTFDKRIQIEVKKPDNLDTVLADSVSLHHVLLNLLVNARDALHEKQQSVSWEPKLTITVEARNIQIDESYIKTHSRAKKGHFVRVAVSDTGCGMDSATQKKVFEPFFTTKEAGKGTGLGLATAYSTVTQYGGWFELSSEIGKGSTVEFYLPVTTLKKTVAPHKEEGDLPRGKETILLVDDDEMIRTLETMTLKRQGYTVLAAANGEECLELFMKERKNIKLVILDLLLPFLSGREVLERIRRIETDVRVIITSGHDFGSDRGSFAELRADDYILKPFTIADLVMSVRDVLDRG